MKRSTGARIGATLAVSALSLALITGCSDEGSDDSKETGSDSSSSSAPAAKTYTAAELQKLILAKGDMDGYEVAKTVGAPETKDEVTASDEKCRPLAFAMSAQAPGDAAAETSVQATEEKDPTDTASQSVEDLAEGEVEDTLTDAMSINVTIVGLSSYEGDGAAETFKSVSDAVESCSGGFTVTADGEKQKLVKITAEKGSGTGDESVAFASEGEMEDSEDTGTVHAEVVRHGNTIATYYTINLGSLMTGKAYPVDAAVVEAQAKKLK
ncbi:hypothetical protein HLK59_37545 [Streptomyces sp. S3(2020)]|uniref:hypothetical protein n=1 Tax=Streptomyces sp. S3(2020) TaxID=2732044 RepID=UPI0014896BF6|nr:hypothetical protein [Streptomyces sp. S3(2020)]NNN35972.1 hypothetical protein [Streptomyces sp. S3(2020)]